MSHRPGAVEAPSPTRELWLCKASLVQREVPSVSEAEGLSEGLSVELKKQSLSRHAATAPFTQGGHAVYTEESKIKKSAKLALRYHLSFVCRGRRSSCGAQTAKCACRHGGLTAAITPPRCIRHRRRSASLASTTPRMSHRSGTSGCRPLRARRWPTEQTKTPSGREIRGGYAFLVIS